MIKTRYPVLVNFEEKSVTLTLVDFPKVKHTDDNLELSLEKIQDKLQKYILKNYTEKNKELPLPSKIEKEQYSILVTITNNN